MSDTGQDHTTIPILGGTVREVQGLLPNEGALQQATYALLSAGFDRGDLSLPDARANAADPVATENPADEHDTRQVRTMMTSTIGIAGALIGGTVASVATGGAMLPVAAAAVAAAAGAGGLTQMGFQGAADTREATHDAQGVQGTLMLSALVRDAEKEKLATSILREQGATAVETVERHGSGTWGA